MAAYSGAGIILNMLLENGASPNIQVCMYIHVSHFLVFGVGAKTGLAGS